MSHSQPDFEEFNFNTAPEEKKFEEIATVGKVTIFRRETGVGGYEYMTDECDGLVYYNSALHDPDIMMVILALVEDET